MRRFRGIATRSTVDKYGDCVVAQGAVYELPVPFLYNHDFSKRIGWVRSAEVSGDKLIATCELDSGAGLPSEIWSSIQSGYVRNLSLSAETIGEAEVLDSGGWLFRRWKWLELSVVERSAHPDAQIIEVGHPNLSTRHRPGAVYL